MTAENDPLEALLESLACDRPIDWDAIALEAGPEYESRIEVLRNVSNIASFNRALQRGQRSSASRSIEANEAMPDNWGELLILERIASTTRSDLFRAWDPGQRCDVALRLLRSQPSGSEPLARAVDPLIGVRHPHLTALLGVDQHDGRLGAWMELLHGVALDRHVDDHGPLRPDEVVRLGVEIGSALAALHEVGAIHGRIKPSNVTLDRENRYRLAEVQIEECAISDGGQVPSVQQDVSGLGLVLWFAATGQTVFSTDGVDEQLPPALLENLARAIDARSGSDFDSARELVRSLEASRAGMRVDRQDSTWRRLGDRLGRFGRGRRNRD